jgi:DNA-binding HxlR family transcriptional regulator
MLKAQKKADLSKRVKQFDATQTSAQVWSIPLLDSNASLGRTMAEHDVKCFDTLADTMEILRGKWTVQTLCALLDGPVRLSQLKRLMPAASKKALTAHLRLLEEAEIIFRRDLSRSVLHVEYEIAETARVPVIALIDQLSHFQKHLFSCARRCQAQSSSRCAEADPMLTLTTTRYEDKPGQQTNG